MIELRNVSKGFKGIELFRDVSLCIPEGKKIFIKALEDKAAETIKHRSLKRSVSYRHLIKLECYKLSKHLLKIEEYQPFKMYW